MPNKSSRKLTEQQMALLKNLEWSEVDTNTEPVERLESDQLSASLEATLSELPDSRETTEFIQRTKKEFDAIRRRHSRPTISFKTKLVFVGAVAAVVAGTMLTVNRKRFKPNG